MTEKLGSAPTGNLSRHSSVEKSRCTSILSPERPMTLAPAASKSYTRLTHSVHLANVDCTRYDPFRQPNGNTMRWTYSGQTMSLTDILGILGVAAIVFLIVSLRVLRQYERGVVFLLGKFEGVRGPGLTLIFVPV